MIADDNVINNILNGSMTEEQIYYAVLRLQKNNPQKDIYVAPIELWVKEFASEA